MLPPLVETNFGQVYPSTAALSAHLRQHGFAAAQIDLNSPFLDHILGRHELEASEAGAYSRSSIESRAAARWVRRHLDDGSLTASDLLVATRRQPLHNVMEMLVSPYSVDPREITARGATDDRELDASYDRYFATRLAALSVDLDDIDLVGLSVPMGPQLLPALRLATALAAGPTRPRIVLGGPTMSLLAEDELEVLLRNNPSVDAIVRYDGEVPLLTLVEQVRCGRWAPEVVPGTASVSNDRLCLPTPGPGPKLDALPTPAYDTEAIAASAQTWLGVIQARGCYWGKCDYCDFVEVFKGSPRYRGRRAELVVDDIEHLVAETGIVKYRLITESIPPAFARRFSELLIERELGVRWSSFIMVDRRFDPELLDMMAASGCDHMVVGMESMVSRVLKLVHKSADRIENIRFLRDSRAAGLRLYVNMIPDLPSTTRDEAMDGLRTLEVMADHVDEINIIPFETTKSSRVGRSPEAFGLVRIEDETRSGHAQLAVNTLPVTDPAMTADERAEVFAAYRRLAHQVATRRATDVVTGPAYRWSEVIETPEGPAFVNLATLETVQLPLPVAIVE